MRTANCVCGHHAGAHDLTGDDWSCFLCACRLYVSALLPEPRGELKPCGTYAAYRRGCRCEPCREALRAYRRNWRAGWKAAGLALALFAVITCRAYFGPAYGPSGAVCDCTTEQID